ncbi:hypothetical protein [Povalibacter sp.]|uniref:hypothetical protein n=1 Tax=Povalibacter sp. TaxID=1962978 RepID=UPI002F414AA4
MQHPGDSRFAADPDMEVELSAQDLIHLTPAAAPTLQTLQAAPTATPHVTNAARPEQVPTRGLSPRIVGAVAATLVAAFALGVLTEFAPPQRIVERPVSNWSPVPDPVATEVNDAPTLMANPFDSSEVFELPPGISKDEARAMVADLLLQRASERQIYSGNRR